MTSQRQLRVLMLGWEYPPRFAGGLGKACQGLSQAMAKLGTQVYFVLPTFPERVSKKHLEVVGAKECLFEAGWEIEGPSSEVVFQKEGEGGVAKILSQAELSPYSIPQGAPVSTSSSYQLKNVKGEKTLVKFHIQEVMRETVTPVTPQTTEIYGKDLWSEIERFCFTVRLLAESHEVDVIHAHDWMTFPAAFEFQKVTGVPVFLHVHATEYDRSGENLNHHVFRIERDGFRRAHHIFAVSRYTAGIIEKLYGVNKKKISVVYNAPEENSHKTWSIKEVSARKPQVVFLGRLTFQKGPDHFLKAASLVAQVNSSARFILCGTGDMMDKLRSQCHKLGIENRVHFAGFVEPSEVDQILQNSQVLVMPSVSEPFGLVALEAIRSGIPVILSKQSGVREVLQRALQVDFWDHEKLADQILAALRLPNLSRQLVDDGLSQMQQLSWEKSAQDVIQAYHRKHVEGGLHGH